MILTHCPFDPTPHSKDWDPKDLGSKTYKGNAKYFGEMVSYMDFSIGRIVNQLDELGLEKIPSFYSLVTMVLMCQ